MRITININAKASRQPNPSGPSGHAGTAPTKQTAATRPAPAERVDDPGYMSRKIRKFRTDKFDTKNNRKF